MAARPRIVAIPWTLRDAEQLGLHSEHIYAAISREEVTPIQIGGKGRIYYLERELRELALRLGVLPDPNGGPPVKATYGGRFEYELRRRRAA